MNPNYELIFSGVLIALMKAFKPMVNYITEWFKESLNLKTKFLKYLFTFITSLMVSFGLKYMGLAFIPLLMVLFPGVPTPSEFTLPMAGNLFYLVYAIAMALYAGGAYDIDKLKK